MGRSDRFSIGFKPTGRRIRLGPLPVSGRESGHYLRPASGRSVKPGPGGRVSLGTTSASVSLAAPTTGPSARRASARQRVWEKVETRARFHHTKEGTKTVEAIGTHAERACLGLDVHKDSITATHLAPGGKTLRTWTVPTIRRSVLALARGVAPATPIVLEASSAGKAVAFVLKEAGRELPLAAPNKVALIAKAPVKSDERDSAALAHLYQSGFLPECYVPSPEIDRLRTLVRIRADLGFKMTRIKNQVHALVTRNLLDEETAGISDWFGIGGIRKLVGLPLPDEEKGHLALYLEQLTTLADQEEPLHTELARAAEQDVALPTGRDLDGIGEKLTARGGALESLDREEAHAG